MVMHLQGLGFSRVYRQALDLITLAESDGVEVAPGSMHSLVVPVLAALLPLQVLGHGFYILG